MNNDKKILNEIKNAIHLVTPDGKLFLYGSRVTGKIHEESDWDILILTQKKYSKETKWKLQHELFNLNLKYNTYIDFTLAEENEWNNNPAYYSLKLNLTQNNSIKAI